MLLNQVMAQVAEEADTLAIEDVFNTTLYNGNNTTRSLITGIDLSGSNAGLVWIESRNSVKDHALYDTVRGPTYDLATNLTAAQTTQATGVTSFNSDGFSMGALAKINYTSANTYAAWTFKKAPKFFDVVTYTGNGVAGRQIPHSLGVAPGMIIIKEDTAGMHWLVYHRSLGASASIILNLTNAAGYGSTKWNSTSPTDSYFVVGGEDQGVNTTGKTYIAYLFAHDDSADGVVQCGSFTTDGSGNASVTLGWEPQYLLLKLSTGTNNWFICDTQRGLPVRPGKIGILYADSSAVEAQLGTASNGYNLRPDGFDVLNFGGSGTVVYLAIRRGPMRVPTDGTKVFAPISYNGNSAGSTKLTLPTGFPVDAALVRPYIAYAKNVYVGDRLRGNGNRIPISSTTESTNVNFWNFTDNMEFVVGPDTEFNANYTNLALCFRRAPGFFDIVCDTGTGSAHNITHCLKSVPGMIWRKSRSEVTQWEVWHSALAASEKLVLNDTASKATDVTAWNSTSPTASLFSVGTGANVNTSAATYVTYLFGDTAGLCKAFSYTGNGTNQDVSCGFVPRFIILKRTDSTGDWYVYDTVRGIVSGNDPYLLLKSTSAEVTTTDYIDPIATGFNVSGALLNINAADYIGWACA
jgi:hypothetical protein